MSVQYNLKTAPVFPSRPEISFHQFLKDNNFQQQQHQINSNQIVSVDNLLKQTNLIQYAQFLNQLEQFVSQSVNTIEDLVKKSSKLTNKLENLETKYKSFQHEEHNQRQSNQYGAGGKHDYELKRKPKLSSFDLSGNFLIHSPEDKNLEQLYNKCRKRPLLERFSKYNVDNNYLIQTFAYLNRETQISNTYRKLHDHGKEHETDKRSIAASSSMDLLSEEDNQLHTKTFHQSTHFTYQNKLNLETNTNNNSRAELNSFFNLFFSTEETTKGNYNHSSPHYHQKQNGDQIITPGHGTTDATRGSGSIPSFLSGFEDDNIDKDFRNCDVEDETNDDVDQVLGRVSYMQKIVPVIRQVQLSAMKSDVRSRRPSVFDAANWEKASTEELNTLDSKQTSLSKIIERQSFSDMRPGRSNPELYQLQIPTNTSGSTGLLNGSVGNSTQLLGGKHINNHFTANKGGALNENNNLQNNNNHPKFHNSNMVMNNQSNRAINPDTSLSYIRTIPHGSPSTGETPTLPSASSAGGPPNLDVYQQKYPNQILIPHWKEEDFRLSLLSDIRSKQYRLKKMQNPAHHYRHQKNSVGGRLSIHNNDQNTVDIVQVMLERASIRLEKKNNNINNVENAINHANKK